MTLTLGTFKWIDQLVSSSNLVLGVVCSGRVPMSSRPLIAPPPSKCEASLPSTYLHPVASPTLPVNNQSAYPITSLHRVAPPTLPVNNQSAGPTTSLHPVAPPTLPMNNQSAGLAFPATSLHRVAPPTLPVNNQSAGLACCATYLHPVAPPTHGEDSQSADRLELDDDGYLKPTDHLQTRLAHETDV